jgi:hypothetical protein
MDLKEWTGFLCLRIGPCGRGNELSGIKGGEFLVQLSTVRPLPH